MIMLSNSQRANYQLPTVLPICRPPVVFSSIRRRRPRTLIVNMFIYCHLASFRYLFNLRCSTKEYESRFFYDGQGLRLR
jgi:hypothetical protein